MSVNISAKFRKDTEVYDGLTAIEHLLVKNPHDRHLVVAVIQPKFGKVDYVEGTVTPTVRFVQVEALTGEARAAAQKLLEAAFKERTGGTVEPPQDMLPLQDDDEESDGETGEGPVAERKPDEWLDPAAAKEDEVGAKRRSRKTPPPAEFSNPDTPDPAGE